MSLLADAVFEEWHIYVPILILSLIFWTWISRVWFSPLAKIPGPSYGPLYGNVKEAARGEAMETSVSWVKQYGGVVRFYHFFGRERLLVADPESIKHVLVTNSRNYVRGSSSLFQWLMPWGLLAVEGHVHRLQKRLMAPSFSTEAVKQHLGVFKRKAELLADKMLATAAADGARGEVNVQRLLRAMTLDVICETAFGYDIKALANPDNEDVCALSFIITRPQLSLQLSLPFYRSLPLAGNRKLWQCKKLVDGLIYSMIDEKQQQHQKQTVSTQDVDSSNRRALLDLLLEARDAETGATYTAEQLHDQIMTFILAGHETSSVSMTWLLLELARHPEMQERVVDEIRTVFPTEASQESATMEDYDRMSFLACCIKESLRLYPPVANITRTVVQGDVIKGFTVPAGTTVIVHLGAMMRTAWPDGEKFVPDRFLDAGSSDAHVWLPFALGPHTCIGSKFALLEMKVVLAGLLRRLRLKPYASRKFMRKNVLLMTPHPEVTLEVSQRELSV